MNDIHGWDTTIREVQLHMSDSFFDEVIGIVCFVIESDHAGDLEFLENGHVIGGS